MGSFLWGILLVVLTLTNLYVGLTTPNVSAGNFNLFAAGFCVCGALVCFRNAYRER